MSAFYALAVMFNVLTAAANAYFRNVGYTTLSLGCVAAMLTVDVIA